MYKRQGLSSWQCQVLHARTTKSPFLYFLINWSHLNQAPWQWFYWHNKQRNSLSSAASVFSWRVISALRFWRQPSSRSVGPLQGNPVSPLVWCIRDFRRIGILSSERTAVTTHHRIQAPLILAHMSSFGFGQSSRCNGIVGNGKYLSRKSHSIDLNCARQFDVSRYTVLKKNGFQFVLKFMFPLSKPHLI